MSQCPENSASESEAIALCEAEIADFTTQRDDCLRRVRELMAAEDVAKGIFHAEEIFLNQRDKLRLEVEIQFRTNKINRIRKGFAESDGAPEAGGFVL
ncbi:MAG: hypothetical protein Q7I92_09535 [Humidesulfovibrio sp.]|jgi:hypothetical protein|nr:hypothetical protein [Humidesulfovibrio sp.]PKN09967.1 MAG: hypothetical protein CVU73_03230 [Deltaproteobacteria bacterium HGW-Deltaproteobacteria-8]